MSKKFISGPLNIIKLIGNINGIDKELYVFLDWHAPLEIETSCKTDKSISKEHIVDIVDFIKDKITTSTDEIDFFLETKQTDLHGIDSRVEDIYLQRLRKFFIDFKSKNQDPKKRLHYVDIRDIPLFNLLTNLEFDNNYVEDIINNPTKLKSSDENLKNLKEDLTDSLKYIENITEIYKDLNDGKFNKEKYDKLSVENKISTKLFIKLMHSYITDKNKQSIQMFVKSYIYNLNILPQFLNYILQQNLDVYNPMVYNMILNFIERFRLVNSQLLDFYFIRRFIDKDYIKKGLLYCGFEHAINIIFLLIKYFDMKLVNASHKKDKISTGTELTFDYINSFLTDSTIDYIQITEFLKNTFIKNYEQGPDKWIQCSTDIL